MNRRAVGENVKAQEETSIVFFEASQKNLCRWLPRATKAKTQFLAANITMTCSLCSHHAICCSCIFSGAFQVVTRHWFGHVCNGTRCHHSLCSKFVINMWEQLKVSRHPANNKYLLKLNILYFISQTFLMLLLVLMCVMTSHQQKSQFRIVANGIASLLWVQVSDLCKKMHKSQRLESIDIMRESIYHQFIITYYISQGSLLQMYLFSFFCLKVAQSLFKKNTGKCFKIAQKMIELGL